MLGTSATHCVPVNAKNRHTFIWVAMLTQRYDKLGKTEYLISTLKIIHTCIVIYYLWTYHLTPFEKYCDSLAMHDT